MSEGPGHVEVAALRRVLHDVNNLTARILTQAEVALLEDDPAQHRVALEAICRAAIEMGAYTRAKRRELLGTDD